jgi:hybrid cluster-associated redox disulfide protein
MVKKKVIKATPKVEEGITKHTLISEAMEKCPEALGIMFEHGLHCVGCGGAAFETIEQGCLVHGMSDKEIEEIVEEINQSVSRKKVKKKLN